MLRLIARVLFLLGLGIASAARAASVAPFVADSAGMPQAPWVFQGLPGVKKAPTRFQVVQLDGHPVLRVEADNAYGDLVDALPRLQSARFLTWRWRVDMPNREADVRHRSTDDRAIQLCVEFDLPLDAVPFGERLVVKLASDEAGRSLPTATLCYLWASRLPPGTVLDDVFSRRLRMIVLRGPDAPLKTWFDERRDIRADFLRLFGDETQQVPPVIGVGVMADSDNTHAHSLAYVADIALAPE